MPLKEGEFLLQKSFTNITKAMFERGTVAPACFSMTTYTK